MPDFRRARNTIMIGVIAACIGTTAVAQLHSADTNGNYVINLSELLRVIQFFNSSGFHCADPPESTEDGYAPGLGGTDCAPHDSDYNPQDWEIGLSELLRLIQFFNTSRYHTDCASEDTYAAGTGLHEPCGQAWESEIILLPGAVPLEMVWIPAGTFLMGRYPGEQDSYDQEDPQHAVSVPGFWLGKYELTKAQWTAMMGTTPWSGHSYVLSDPDSPAVYVSWSDSQAFITALNAHIASTGQGAATIRLPSEAEWEYACRGGTTTRFYWGDDPSCTAIGAYAWSWGNCSSDLYAHVVGLKLPNAWSLYDMSGNVWEWCEDDWHGDHSGASGDGSPWVDSPRGSLRVRRGGVWSDPRQYCRSAVRPGLNPEAGSTTGGFRLARCE